MESWLSPVFGHILLAQRFCLKGSLTFLKGSFKIFRGEHSLLGKKNKSPSVGYVRESLHFLHCLPKPALLEPPGTLLGPRYGNLRFHIAL